MLTENDVVDAVCRFLEVHGYTIEQRLLTTQKGDDIVATRADGVRLLVEAKGATSARDGSNRYGRPFESAAARVHVAEAVFKAAQVLSRAARVSLCARAAIALPRNDVHRRLVDSVAPVLDDMGVAVFWVDADRQVAVCASWGVLPDI